MIQFPIPNIKFLSEVMKQQLEPLEIVLSLGTKKTTFKAYVIGFTIDSQRDGKRRIHTIEFRAVK